MKFKAAIFIFLFSLPMMSQETASIDYAGTPLNEVISDLESKFNIRLSFNPELITDQAVTYQNSEATLQDVISAVESQTDVEFSRVSDRYYIVRKRREFDLTNTQQLDEIIIKEYLTSGINERTDNSILVSPDKLGILPGLTEPDILQSLQMIPGVQSPTETASGLFIRGGTPDQNLILWDGIKMYHSGHFLVRYRRLTPILPRRSSLLKAEPRPGMEIGYPALSISPPRTIFRKRHKEDSVSI